MPRRKSTARLWEQAPSPQQKYRDRQRLTLPDGSKRDVAGYGPTRAAASDELDRKLDRLIAQHPGGQTLTFTQLVAKLLEHKRTVLGRKQKTIWNDADNYKRHIKPSIGSKYLMDITLTELEAIQTRLIHEKKYRTAQLVTILLKSAFKYAMRLYRPQIIEGSLRLVNIAEDLHNIKVPASAKPKPLRPWTMEHVEAFLGLSRARYEASLRSLYYPLFHTAIAAGLRRGELLGLPRDALSYRSVRVDGKKRRQYYLNISEQLVFYDNKHHFDTPKTAASTRPVPIGPTLARALRHHLHKLERVAAQNPAHQPNSLMFPSYEGTPIHPGNLYRARDELIAALDLPHSTLHQMRKVFTTYLTKDLIRNGKYSPKIIQEILGHTHPHVAQEVYTLVIQADLDSAAIDFPVRARSLDTTLDNSEKEEDVDSAESTSLTW